MIVFLRNNELLQLTGKDINRGLVTESGSAYMTIALTFRKTNQADASKGINLS